VRVMSRRGGGARLASAPAATSARSINARRSNASAFEYACSPLLPRDKTRATTR